MNMNEIRLEKETKKKTKQWQMKNNMFSPSALLVIYINVPAVSRTFLSTLF